MRRHHWLKICMVVVLAAVATASDQRASGASQVVDDCTFDVGTSTVTAHTFGPRHFILTVIDDAIEWRKEGDSGVYSPCGDATVFNTDQIEVFGTDANKEAFTLAKPTLFSPGKTPESTGSSEIEIHTHLGLGTPRDSISMVSSSSDTADETYAVGDAGFAWNNDDDADLTYQKPAKAFLETMWGNDLITGQGGFGTGGPYQLGIMTAAGPGSDTVIGTPRSDQQLFGGDGPVGPTDIVEGRNGADRISVCANDVIAYGGKGADKFLSACGVSPPPDPLPHNHLFGEGGQDTFYVRQGWIDDIDGGGGTDTAQIDEGMDTAVNVETFLP